MCWNDRDNGKKLLSDDIALKADQKKIMHRSSYYSVGWNNNLFLFFSLISTKHMQFSPTLSLSEKKICYLYINGRKEENYSSDFYKYSKNIDNCYSYVELVKKNPDNKILSIWNRSLFRYICKVSWTIDRLDSFI